MAGRIGLPGGPLCFDATQRDESDFSGALNACGDFGMSLPAPGQLAQFLVQENPSFEADWTSGFQLEGGGFAADTLDKSTGNPVAIGVAVASETLGFRCMTTPMN